MIDIRRVAYTFNSALEEPYFLDLMLFRDGITQMDLHKTFKSGKEFFEAMNEVIPLLEDLNENREGQAQNE